MTAPTHLRTSAGVLALHREGRPPAPGASRRLYLRHRGVRLYVEPDVLRDCGAARDGSGGLGAVLDLPLERGADPHD